MDTREPSRFLSLPGEIRNTIYEYALTFDDGVCVKYGPQYSPRDTRVRLHPAKPLQSKRKMRKHFNHEANQLKFVCRQLYEEVAGLELRFNTIHFTYAGGARQSLLQQFNYFIGHLSTSNQDRLRDVELRNVVKRMSKDRSRTATNLDAWCKAHPKAKVQYICYGYPVMQIGVSRYKQKRLVEARGR